MQDASERALILAPHGRDAALAAGILAEARIEAATCKDVPSLVRELQNGGAFAVVSEEALQDAGLHSLSDLLRNQPEWSDFQFILLTFRGGGLERNRAAARFLDVLGNVTFLERPFHPTTLVSLAQAALGGRRRQYQARRSLLTIRESERHFREVTESLPQLVWTCRPDGSCDYLSPQWRRYTGKGEAEQLGVGWLQQVHPDDRERVTTQWRAAADKGENYETEYRLRRHDEVYRWFRTLAVPLRNEKGAIVKWFGSNTDIDEIKAAEEKLKASEERLRAFMNATTDAVFQISPGWEVMKRADGRDFPTDTEHSGGAWLTRYIHPDDQAHVRQAIESAIETKSAFGLELRVKRPNETLGWTHFRAIPLINPAGDIIEWFAAASDITQRKEHQQQIELLMREVNHRSKNMLSLIQSIAHLTAAPGTQDFVRRFGDRIRSLSAAQDLLIKHEWKAVPLVDLIRMQLSHFADLIGTRIAFSGPELSVSQKACQAIGMAVHELTTNATKYGALSNNSGRIDIAWDIQVGAEEPEFILSWVERGGPPVAKPPRRGFGSTVTSGMVEASVNGEVFVEYAPAGLIWRLKCAADNILDDRAPLPVPGEPRGQTQVDGATMPVPGTRSVRTANGLRVLVVEDEPLIAAEISSLLEQGGFQVVGPASSVREALALLQHEGCDTAILDVNLGMENSEPVSQELTRIGTPFIVVSGYSREQLPLCFRSAPFIHKPLQAAELHALLASAL